MSDMSVKTATGPGEPAAGPGTASPPAAEGRAGDKSGAAAEGGVGGEVLRVDGVRKRYGGVVALAGVTCGFPRNTITAVVGDNGAGKSTLLRIIAGAEHPDGGTIEVNGSPVRFRSPDDARSAGIETVYQDLALADNLNATENLFMGREQTRGRSLLTFMRHRSMRRDATRIIRGLDVRIPSVRVPVVGLSGGQRQGVAIARAVNWGSEVILMDEPTAALGVAETAKVEEIVAGLRERGMTMIVVSHNLDQVFRLADRIAVMRRGELVDVLDASATDGQQVVSLITGLSATGTASEATEEAEPGPGESGGAGPGGSGEPGEAGPGGSGEPEALA